MKTHKYLTVRMRSMAIILTNMVFLLILYFLLSDTYPSDRVHHHKTRSFDDLIFNEKMIQSNLVLLTRCFSQTYL